MDSWEFLEKLDELGLKVFTFKDVARIVQKPKPYTRLFVSRMKKRGLVNSIERGKYATKDAGIFQVASNLVYPSYVSFLSSLSYHKLTTQIPRTMQVVVLKQKKAVRYAGYNIKFIRTNKSRFFGFEKRDGAFIAEPEKALVDGVQLPSNLPLSEAFYALGQERVSKEKVLEYALKMGSPVLLKRVGYLLSLLGFDCYEAVKEKLKIRYDLLNPLHPPKGKKDKKWKLVVNEVLG